MTTAANWPLADTDLHNYLVMESQNLHHSSLDLESHTYVHACPLACSKPVQAIFPSCAIYVYIRICIDVHVHELQDKKACCEARAGLVP